MRLNYWSAPPLWRGETAFVVCGGPSVLQQDLRAIEGRRIIAVNSSAFLVPRADVVLFGDTRWWNHNKKLLAHALSVRPQERPLGQPLRVPRIITTSDAAGGLELTHMKKVAPLGVSGKSALGYAQPVGLSAVRHELSMARTTLTAALNLCWHIGVGRVVLLGADSGPATDGRTHHHAPHPWAVKKGCWDEQRPELEMAAIGMRAAHIEVLNASPGSRLSFWPIVKLEDVADAQG